MMQTETTPLENYLISNQKSPGHFNDLLSKLDFEKDAFGSDLWRLCRVEHFEIFQLWTIEFLDELKKELEKLQKDTINSVVEGPVSMKDAMGILKETVKLEEDWENEITAMCECTLSEE